MNFCKNILALAGVLVTLAACGGGSSSSSWPTSSQTVAAAYIQSAAFRNTSTMMMWGNNGYGQLGNSNSGNSQTPVAVNSLSRIKAGSVGGTHTLGIDTANNVWAWGNNGYGQLGNHTVTASSQPVRIFTNYSTQSYLASVSSVAAGGYHSLALDNNRNVWIWGVTTWQNINTGTPLDFSQTARLVLNPVNGIGLNAAMIAAGGNHSLALDRIDGSVWAWGNNYRGQLGDNTITIRNEPVQVVDVTGAGILTGVLAIAAGGSHSLAIVDDGSQRTGTVVAWGYGNYGQLGNNTYAADPRNTVYSMIPVQVVIDANNTPLTGVIAIAAGLDHSLALDSNGNVWAWGYNLYGQLGNTTVKDSPVAVKISGLSSIDRILAIGYHSLAFSGSSAWGWGYNAYGQVGNNSTSNVLSPTPVAGFP